MTNVNDGSAEIAVERYLTTYLDCKTGTVMGQDQERVPTRPVAGRQVREVCGTFRGPLHELLIGPRPDGSLMARRGKSAVNSLIYEPNGHELVNDPATASYVGHGREPVTSADSGESVFVGTAGTKYTRIPSIATYDLVPLQTETSPCIVNLPRNSPLRYLERMLNRPPGENRKLTRARS